VVFVVVVVVCRSYVFLSRESPGGASAEAEYYSHNKLI
jgi:hypothetical protein